MEARFWDICLQVFRSLGLIEIIFVAILEFKRTVLLILRFCKMLRNQHYFFTIKVEHWRSGAESKAQLPIV